MTAPIIKFAAVWLASVLTAMAPAPADVLGDSEDTTARSARITQIGADIAEVVYDPAEQPIFMGPRAREQTAAIVSTFAVEEGMNLASSIDAGTRRGDRGRSWCIMQINVGTGKTIEGWTGPELIADRKKCIRAGLHALRRSYNYCRKNHESERFAVYASGNCDVGREISRHRYNRAMRRLTLTPAPKEIVAPAQAN